MHPFHERLLRSRRHFLTSTASGVGLWMAGGGVKGGQVVGKTDDIGWNIVENPIHVNDFHATVLALFGLDHKRLTYRFQGRNFRPTDVAGEVVKKLLA